MNIEYRKRGVLWLAVTHPLPSLISLNAALSAALHAAASVIIRTTASQRLEQGQTEAEWGESTHLLHCLVNS